MRWVTLWFALFSVFVVACAALVPSPELPPVLHEGYYRVQCERVTSGALECVYLTLAEDGRSLCVRVMSLAPGATVDETDAWTTKASQCGGILVFQPPRPEQPSL